MDFFKKKIHTFNSDLVFLLLRLTGKKSVTFLFWETLLSDLKKQNKKKTVLIFQLLMKVRMKLRGNACTQLFPSFATRFTPSFGG